MPGRQRLRRRWLLLWRALPLQSRLLLLLLLLLPPLPWLLLRRRLWRMLHVPRPKRRCSMCTTIQRRLLLLSTASVGRPALPLLLWQLVLLVLMVLLLLLLSMLLVLWLAVSKLRLPKCGPGLKERCHVLGPSGRSMLLPQRRPPHTAWEYIATFVLVW
jgi:hypothetical protein